MRTASFEDDLPVQFEGSLPDPSDSGNGRLFNNLMFEEEGELDKSPGHHSLGAVSFTKGLPSSATNSPNRFGNSSTKNPLSLRADPIGKQKEKGFPQTVQVDIYTGDPRCTEDASEIQPCSPHRAAEHVTHTSFRSLGLGTSLSETVSRKAYLAAPCDGDPTVMSLVRHQSSGLLELYLEVNPGRQMFLAAAYKRRGGYYSLFQERGDTDTSGPSYLGKVTANFPNRTDYVLEEQEEGGRYVNTAGVTFKKRFSATGVPRRLAVVIPDRECPSAWQQSKATNLVSAYRAAKAHRKSTSTITARAPIEDAGLEVLKNALPFWDERAKGYVLDMSPRIRLPSVKNFQMKRLVDGAKEPQGEVLLEFGKNTESVFALECRAPISILQAFSVGVAMVDSSLMITM